MFRYLLRWSLLYQLVIQSIDRADHSAGDDVPLTEAWRVVFASKHGVTSKNAHTGSYDVCWSRCGSTLRPKFVHEVLRKRKLPDSLGYLSLGLFRLRESVCASCLTVLVMRVEMSLQKGRLRWLCRSF